MKAVILAGGYGTRLAEETTIRPKPMVEIGGKPILWHIMKTYSAYGINDFIICCGYKGYMIKEYFANYALHTSDFCVDLKNNQIVMVNKSKDPWTVTAVDTGEKTGTGGRLKRVQDLVGDERFCFTYGDGLSSCNIPEIIKFHTDQKVLATMTAVHPPPRFGTFDLPDGTTHVRSFKEKGPDDQGWVNGGFFVLEPKIFDYIEGDRTMWETDPLERLASAGMLAAYKHHGFWHCMDHLSDKIKLEDMWTNNKAPWKIWQ